MIFIKNLFGRVLFEFETTSMRVAVEAAVATRADLTGANFYGANLTGADLTGADLTGANLTGADLTRANFYGANFYGANLTGADLTRANLTGANLTRANFYGADLTGADLTPIRADFIDVISRAPHEVPALIAALKEGRVDGSTYTGPCSCLVGTIATAQGKHVDDAEFKLKIKKDSSRAAERFFMGIREGDTPATNQASAIALEWASTWYATMKEAFAA